MLQSLMGTRSTTTAKKPSKPEEETDEYEVIDRVFEALKYEGFDVIKVRANAIAKLTFPQLKIMLSAYVMTGNSLTKRIQKGRVADKNVANSISTMMKGCSIKEKSSTSDGLTLPRLAIAFPAIVIAIRHRAPKIARLETTTPFHLQDLCLNGYASTIACAGCEDFLLKFSLILARAKDKDAKEETVKANLENFRQLGRSSLMTDVIGSNMLGVVITDQTKLSALAVGYGFPQDKLKSKAAVAEKTVVATEAEEEENPIQEEKVEVGDLTSSTQ